MVLSSANIHPTRITESTLSTSIIISTQSSVLQTQMYSNISSRRHSLRLSQSRQVSFPSSKVYDDGKICTIYRNLSITLAVCFFVLMCVLIFICSRKNQVHSLDNYSNTESFELENLDNNGFISVDLNV